MACRYWLGARLRADLWLGCIDGIPRRLSPWKPGEQDLLGVVCGYVAGMALGLSRVVWQKAVIADTWALGVLLFATMLCLLMRWMVTPERKRFLLEAAFVFGLLLTSNQELIVLTPSLLLLVMLGDQELGRDLFPLSAFLAITNWLGSKFALFPWVDYYAVGNGPLLLAFLLAAVAAVIAMIRTRRVGFEWKPAVLCALVLLLGLGCYVYLPIASMTNPPMNWGYARTVQGFVHVVTRGQYERPHPTDELGRFVAQLWTKTKETGKGFGWLYFTFAVLPFYVSRQAGRTARNWLLGLIAVFIGTGPLVVAALNPSADLAGLQMVAPYFCPMYVVLAVWTGLGLVVLGTLVLSPIGSKNSSCRTSC
jgi:hypothetical protein